MAKRVCIVGNDIPLHDHGAFVDGCDLVVRFNLCESYRSALTGNRTDILCLRNAEGHRAQNIRNGRTWLEPDCCQRASEFWFIDGDDGDEAPLVDRYNLNGRIIYIHMSRQVRRMLNDVSFGSISLHAIEYIFNEERFSGYEIHLICMNWRHVRAIPTPKSHDWDAELKYISLRVASGALIQHD